MTAEERRTLAARQQIGWRGMIIGLSFWLIAILILPMGITGSLGPTATQLRLTASFGFATISLLGGLIALWGLRPWKGKGTRKWAITLTLVALLLGDLYIMSWHWRLS